MSTSTVLGLRTVGYQVPDISAAKQWYTRAFGVEPYFDQPFYVGFNIGGYELGLQPDPTPAAEKHNSVTYWGVDDLKKRLQHFLDCGASLVSDIEDVGGGIQVATVSDPYGNAIGLIYNPHFTLDAA